MDSRLEIREEVKALYQQGKTEINKEVALTIYQGAIALLDSLQELREKEDFYLAYKIYKNEGNIYFNQNNDSAAIIAYQSAVNFAKKMKQTDNVLRGKIDTYLAICDSYLHLKKIDMAIVAFRSALKEFSHLKIKSLAEITLGNAETNPEAFWEHYNQKGCATSYLQSKNYQKITQLLHTSFQEHQLDDLTDSLKNLSVAMLRDKSDDALSLMFNALKLDAATEAATKQRSATPQFFSNKRKLVEDEDSACQHSSKRIKYS